MKKVIIMVSIFLLLFGLSGCLSEQLDDIKEDKETNNIVEEEDSSNLETAYNNLTYSTILGENKNNETIDKKLNLVEELNDCIVSWEIRSPYVKYNGEVIRPLSTQTDKNISLKATIKQGNKSKEKIFELVIKKSSGENEDKVLLDYSDIENEDLRMANSDLNTVVYDLDFPKKAPNGSEISWDIEDTEYISSEGIIKRPVEEDKKIKVIANFNYEGINKQKEFEVTIKKESSNSSEALDLAYKALTEYIIKGENTSLDKVSKNLNLIKQGIDGTIIKWKSENPDLVSDDGSVNFSNISQEIKVRLTAGITVDEPQKILSQNGGLDEYDASAVSQKTFIVTIPKYDASSAPGMPIIERRGSIIILSKPEGATYDIYYTLDGSDPTEPSNPSREKYEGPFEVSSAVTLQVVSFDGGSYSSIARDDISNQDLGIYKPDIEDDNIVQKEKVKTPVFDPDGFTSQVPLAVSITTETPDSKIYYTTDGSTPSAGDNLYSSDITVSSTMTIKAVAIKSGLTDSDIASANFTILEPPSVSNPVFSPDEGSYAQGSDGAGAEITISTSTSGADIYYEYTTDGSVPSDPTTGSTDYSIAGGISTDGLADDTTVKIKAIAVKSGYTDSNVVSATYYIDSSPVAASVEISPGNDMTIYVGDTIQFSFVAKDSNGYKIDGYGTESYSMATGGANGNVDASGLFTAGAAGTATVQVDITEDGGHSDVSGTITILDPASNSFDYNGTTYNGASAGSGDPETATDANISITSPTDATFDADAFFTLEGDVTYDNDGANQYAWVTVTKDSTGDQTTYWVGGDAGAFSTRIWLRFGSGTYTVKVLKAQVTDEGKNDNGDGDSDSYDGDILGWQYYTPAIYTFTVNNTKNEDGRYIYPSHFIQSDNTAIANKAAEVVADAGASTNQEKAQALHDWVVKYLYYDDDSLVSGQRKKQDAITTFQSGNGSLETTDAVATAVCEGYTSLYNAMLRSQGIRAKAIAGTAGGGLHAWTAVETTDGSGVYKYADTTWDDPGPNDKKITNLYQTYFWKDSLSNHTVTGDRPERVITRISEIKDDTEIIGSDFYRYSY